VHSQSVTVSSNRRLAPARQASAKRAEEAAGDRVDNDHQGREAAEGYLGVGADDGVGEQDPEPEESAADEAADGSAASILVLEAGDDRADCGDHGEGPVSGGREPDRDAQDGAEDEWDDTGQDDLSLPGPIAKRDRVHRYLCCRDARRAYSSLSTVARCRWLVRARTEVECGVLTIKRIYEPAGSEDGLRILVDRLWPRGVGKEDAALDLWLKEVAPSTELRTWFGHDPRLFGEFADRYRAELEENPGLDRLLEAVRENETVTLLYGARDPECNHAAVLRDFARSHDL
jgi:uncharacterized protein YeaO (DUF488 family)